MYVLFVPIHVNCSWLVCLYRHNAMPGRNVFGTQQEFENAQRARRRRLILEYLHTLAADTRSAVVKACKKDLEDLGLGDVQ
jgi:hypothetical protein